jgi:outer membrane protein OmpA-like peptidoglycan-associated protein
MEVFMGTSRLEMSRPYLTPAALILASFLLSAPASAADGNKLGHLLPIGDQALAFHGGYILPKEKLAGTLIGARESKSFFGTGDTLYIRFIRSLDIHTGDWVTAYRMANPVFHPITNTYMGRLVKIVGILEVGSEPNNGVAEARVIQGLDTMAPGDPVMLYTMPASVSDQNRSDEPLTGTVVEFKQQGLLTAQGEIVYIDLGAQDGVAVGDRMKVIRAGARESLRTFLPDYALAELKVLSVQERTATTKVVKSLNTLRRGDRVTRVALSQAASPAEERVEDLVGSFPKPGAGEQDTPAVQESAKTQESARTALKPVYFPYDRWSFSPADLTEATEFLKENPTMKLLIEGYADERGTREYNLILGEKRARAISQYLESRGFQNPITVTSYGKERPVCNEDEESCHSRNRRAQFLFDAN